MRKFLLLLILTLTLSLTLSSQSIVTKTGNITALNGMVVLSQSTPANGNLDRVIAQSVTVNIQGTFSGLVLTPYVSDVGINGPWTATQFLTTVNGSAVSTVNAAGNYGILNTAGFLFTAVKATSFSSGTANITMIAGGSGGGGGGGGSGGSGCSSPCTVVGGDSAGSPTAGTVLAVQGISGGTTIPMSQASGSVAAGAYAVGSLPPAAGVLASGTVTSAMTGTTSTSVIAGTSSNYVYITQCVVSNASQTVSTDIILQDGTGGTTLYTLPAPAGLIAGTGSAGSIIPFPVPLRVPTSGNGLFAANVTTGSSTKISCSGFKSTVAY